MRATLLLIFLSLFVTVQVHAQTNDPLVGQQYYIGAHNIDDLWNITTGSSGTRIAIHSATGFTNSHEDMTGSRFLAPYSNWFSPEKGFASELAGIVGANSDNNIGIAGINWNATMRSYNFVEANASNPDPDYEFTSENINYHLSIENMSTMLDVANSDNMDVHLFSFGVPTTNVGKLSILNQHPDPLNLYKMIYEGPNFPTQPPTHPPNLPPTQGEQFKNDFFSALQTIGTTIWNTITNPTYTISSPYETFRSKLWDSAENHNSILVAPVGDVSGDKLPAPTLMPFSFDDFVIGVGGGEFETGFRSHWEGAGESPYVNITAAAKDLVTLSGDGYDSYNTEFSSTTGSAAIVAGVASLLKTQVSNYSYEDIRHILQNTAIDIEDPGVDNKTGHGWMDAQAAINYIQNNDFVRKSVPKSEINNLQIEEDGQFSYKIDQTIAFERFSGVGCASDSQLLSGITYGEKKMLKGRIDFDYQFADVPDIWLRNSSTGTDVSPIPFESGSKQFYEPFEKSIRITSVDKSGFEFELDFWGLKVSNSVGATICIGDLPIINESHAGYSGVYIDYTAVGDELPPPPPPPPSPSVSISGPSNMFQGSTDTFTANVSGGSPPYSYQWYYRHENDCCWNSAGVSTQTYSHTAGSPNGEYVRVVVQDQYPHTEEAQQYFTILGWSMQAEGPSLPDEFSLTQNYPNPFNPSSTIRYELPERAEVSLAVYNMLGQRVALLIDGEIQPGQHEAVFDASALSSGNYIARFNARGISGESFEQTLNMQLVK